MTDLRPPSAEHPRWIDWVHGGDELNLAWWEAATAVHGGRQDTPVVRASNGYMYVFNSRGACVGTVEVQESQLGGIGAFEFWQLSRPDMSVAQWLMADLIRPSGCVLARVDGTLGVADRADRSNGRAWRVAHACLLLGFHPPMGLALPATNETFIEGVEECGDRWARRIKRAILSRLALERRVHRERADLIESNWR